MGLGESAEGCSQSLMRTAEQMGMLPGRNHGGGLKRGWSGLQKRVGLSEQTIRPLGPAF